MKAIIAYFSVSGITKGVAEITASLIGGELFEILPVQPYSREDLDWTNAHSRSSVEMSDPSFRPAIKSVPDTRAFDVIFIGFPIWWYTAPTVVLTFLEECNLVGKKVIPFATSGSSGYGNTNVALKKACHGATLLAGKRLSGRETEIKDWLRSLNL